MTAPTQAMADLLRKRGAFFVFCLKVTRLDGTTVTVTTSSSDVAVDLGDGDGSQTYKASSGIAPSSIQHRADAPGSIDLEVVLGTEFAAADIRAGKYDHARVQVFLVDRTAPGSGIISEFLGHVATATLDGALCRFQVMGMAGLLRQHFTRQWSRTCRAAFCDSECGLNPATYTQTGTATTGGWDYQFVDTSQGEAAGFFSHGTITWTSGDNNGLVSGVRAFAGGIFVLTDPLPNVIGTGDAYSVLRGCDKTANTCAATFSNIVNFRGEPFIPGSDAKDRAPNAVIIL